MTGSDMVGPRVFLGMLIALASAVSLLLPAETHAAAGTGAALLARDAPRTRCAVAAAAKATKPNDKVKIKAKPKDKTRPPSARPAPGSGANTSEPSPALIEGKMEPRPLPTTYRGVALLPLSGIDVDVDLLHEFEVALGTEIDETKGLRSISPGDVLNDLGRVGIDLGTCEGDVACLADAARFAGAHLAIEARVAALGGTLSVSMRLLDTEKALEVSRVADSVSEDAAARAVDVHRLAVQLLVPDTYVGTLKINCTQAGAQVYLDDKLVGDTPIVQPLKKLRAGPHILRVAKEGFSDVNQFVDVVFNRASTLDVDLSTTTIAGVLVEAESQEGLGSLYVRVDEAGVELRIDAEPRGMTPLHKAITGIPAGKRRISLRKEGLEPLVLEAEVQAAQRTDIEVTRTPRGFSLKSYAIVDAKAPISDFESLHEVTAVNADGRGPRGALPAPVEPVPMGLYAGYASAGLGALCLAAGAYFAVRVQSANATAKRQIEGLEPLGGSTYSCSNVSETSCQARHDTLARLRTETQRDAILQWVGFGLGAGLAAAGAALIYVEPGAIAAVPMQGGALVIGQVRF